MIINLNKEKFIHLLSLRTVVNDMIWDYKENEESIDSYDLIKLVKYVTELTDGIILEKKE